MAFEEGRKNAMFIHLTLLPWIPTAGELKTKPTQHSVKELRSIGIQPDVLICRSDRHLPQNERVKIALFTNVAEKAVISLQDVDSIYKIPALLESQGLDDIVLKRFKMDLPKADLTDWERVLYAQANPHGEIKIAMVGKYVDLTEAYKSLNEALHHAGLQNRRNITIEYIDAEDIEKNGVTMLDHVDAILVPGGFGERGVEGKIQAVRYARERGVPYLGICLGMQVAMIEFARHVCGMEDAHSTEMTMNTTHPVVALITEWINEDGVIETRDEESDLGGTMRLGAQTCNLIEGTLARKLYDAEQIIERHRHRYEVNNAFLPELVEKGLVVSGQSSDNELVEMIELPDHPWFLGCQFHPEFTSTPRDGHPLFTGFIEAAIKHQEESLKS